MDRHLPHRSSVSRFLFMASSSIRGCCKWKSKDDDGFDFRLKLLLCLLSNPLEQPGTIIIHHHTDKHTSSHEDRQMSVTSDEAPPTWKSWLFNDQPEHQPTCNSNSHSHLHPQKQGSMSLSESFFKRNFLGSRLENEKSGHHGNGKHGIGSSSNGKRGSMSTSNGSRDSDDLDTDNEDEDGEEEELDEDTLMWEAQVDVDTVPPPAARSAETTSYLVDGTHLARIQGRGSQAQEGSTTVPFLCCLPLSRKVSAYIPQHTVH